MSTVVMFNHPGDEHVATRTGVYPWNTGDHRRKYLELEATLAERQGGSFKRASHQQKVAFWGEFEPDTQGQPLGSGDEMPKWLPLSLHRLLPLGEPPDGGQNTDPWVFGKAFRYAFCRQYTKQTAYLRNLVHGDLLLFGSFMKRAADGAEADHFNFFLDTVFVVEAGYPWEPANRVPQRLLDPAYVRAAESRFDPQQLRRCTLYEGVMLTDTRSSLPFSFAPCWPSGSAGPVRRARPLVSDLFDYRTQNPQVVPHFEGVDARQAWRAVVDRCLSVGCELAVEIATPTVRGATSIGRAGVC